MKKKTGRKKEKKIDADLDVHLENYEPSDSDDGFDDNERNLLNNAVGRKVQKGEEEVLKVYSSSDESDNVDDDDDQEEIEDEEDESFDENQLYGGGEIGSDMDSDIEGKSDDDGLPDSKAWGADRKQYYDTDYVDKDYLDFDDEEAAIEEEKEADAIQRRLMSHLEGTDFTLGLLDTVEGKKKDATKKRNEPELEEDSEKVKVDLSKLSKDEFIDLMKRKSPEMFPIINQCKEQLKYLEEKVAPILELVDNNLLHRSKVIDYLEYFHQITLHYAVNVLFYVHLKELGIRTSDHSVLKRIDGLNLLIGELDVLRKKVDSQINIILEKAANGEELNAEPEPENPIEPEPKNRKEKRKRKLDLLKKQEEYRNMVALKKQKLMKAQKVTFEKALSKKEEKPVIYSEEESEEGEEEPDKEEEQEISRDKRAVTFEILKNKGLTPHRKKENRNPRVKHRNKFKKALVRRKGQVREPRKELTKYGGEFTGINPFVTKSIRIK